MKKLSRSQLRQIKGGDDCGAVNCKTSATSCVYVTIQGHVYSGTCGNVVKGTGPQFDQCGCTWGNDTQPASECNQ